jgi:hypothetical protein
LLKVCSPYLSNFSRGRSSSDHSRMGNGYFDFFFVCGTPFNSLAYRLFSVNGTAHYFHVQFMPISTKHVQEKRKYGHVFNTCLRYGHVILIRAQATSHSGKKHNRGQTFTINIIEDMCQVLTFDTDLNHLTFDTDFNRPASNNRIKTSPLIKAQ